MRKERTVNALQVRDPHSAADLPSADRAGAQTSRLERRSRRISLGFWISRSQDARAARELGQALCEVRVLSAKLPNKAKPLAVPFCSDVVALAIAMEPADGTTAPDA
jgi:hypothetical protein